MFFVSYDGGDPRLWVGAGFAVIGFFTLPALRSHSAAWAIPPLVVGLTMIARGLWIARRSR